MGWITGHSYIIYGPLANCATTTMFEGVPNFPDFGRFWDIVDKHKVNQFYTAPTALRALMKEGMNGLIQEIYPLFAYLVPLESQLKNQNGFGITKLLEKESVLLLIRGGKLRLAEY